MHRTPNQTAHPKVANKNGQVKASRNNSVSANGNLSDTAIGQEIRKLRRARGKSLADIAHAIGRSVSFISQLERGGAEPSIADLKGIARELDVQLGWFFLLDEIPVRERGRVVRRNGRRRLGTQTDGLVEELLSPDIGGTFETFLSRFAPGSALADFTERDTEEEGYLIKGCLDLWIGDEKFQLQQGDSFRIVKEPFRWANPSDEEAVVVWVISPPIY